MARKALDVRIRIERQGRSVTNMLHKNEAVGGIPNGDEMENLERF